MREKNLTSIDERTGRVILGSVIECECTHRRFNVLKWDKENMIKCVRCGKRYKYNNETKEYIAE